MRKIMNIFAKLKFFQNFEIFLQNLNLCKFCNTALVFWNLKILFKYPFSAPEFVSLSHYCRGQCQCINLYLPQKMFSDMITLFLIFRIAALQRQCSRVRKLFGMQLFFFSCAFYGFKRYWVMFWHWFLVLCYMANFMKWQTLVFLVSEIKKTICVLCFFTYFSVSTRGTTCLSVYS